MKRIYNIVLAALVVLATGACTEEYPEYVKGELPEGALAFFGELPASYDLTDANGSFSVTASRTNASGEAVVSLSSEADELFTVPASVTFADGSKTAEIVITYDPAKIVADVVYKFALTINDNLTPYAVNTCAFTAGVVTPEEWTVFKEATFTEGWWGETHKHTIKYREEGNIRYCIVEGDDECGDNCEGGSSDGGVWGTGADFEFIWYLDKKDKNGHQVIEVPGSYIYTSADGDVYAFDTYHGYNDVLGYDDGSFWDYMEAYPGENCYYDGNGGFYFNFLYLIPAISNGWMPSAYDMVAVCDGFTRTVDYNKDFEYAPLYDGEVSSMMFTQDGKTPDEFSTNILYNFDYEVPEADKDGKVETVYTEYYVANYFGQGFGLAFMAPIPEQLTDGSEIKNVENGQETGIVVFGNEMYVNVNKGSVSFPTDSDFPVFTLKVAAYSEDANGNRTYSFGPFEDMVTALDYTDYTYRQLSPKGKAFYCGTFDMPTYDENGDPATMQITISDDGKDEEGVEWLAISNLSGLAGYGIDDTVYAMWEGGFVYLFPQDMENATYPYKGEEYPMYIGVANLYTEEEADYLLGGYIEDDDLIAFTAYPGTETCSGLYVGVEGLGWLTGYDNITLTVSAPSTPTPAPTPAPKLGRKLAPKAAATEIAGPRQFNAFNAVPFGNPGKNFPEPTRIIR